MAESPLLEMLSTGSPYLILVVVVVVLYRRLNQFDEQRAKEVDQYIELIRQQSVVIAENTVALKSVIAAKHTDHGPHHENHRHVE